MAFYKGTYQECLNYDNQVTTGESYNQDRGINWGVIHEHPNGVDFAILKHSDYTSTMNEIAELSEDWFPDIE